MKRLGSRRSKTRSSYVSIRLQRSVETFGRRNGGGMVAEWWGIPEAGFSAALIGQPGASSHEAANAFVLRWRQLTCCGQESGTTLMSLTLLSIISIDLQIPADK